MASPSSSLSYSDRRLAKIARNEARLADLGLTTFKLVNDKPAVTKKKRAKNGLRLRYAPPPPGRRSIRNVSKTIDYTKEKIDEDLPEAPSSSHGNGWSFDTDDMSEDELPEPASKSQETLDNMVDSIAAMNDSIKSVPLEADATIEIARLAKLGGDNIPHAQAIKRWGLAVATPTGTPWSTFYESRLSVPPPTSSPFALRQELYASDGWRLLIACALMTRCSSNAVKDRCLAAFFALAPTPTAFLSVDPTQLLTAINSLGFQFDRTKACADITHKWLTRGSFVIDAVRVPKGAESSSNKIVGCGPFVVDSYYLFAKSDALHAVTCGIYDVVVYQGWLRKQKKGGREEEKEEETEVEVEKGSPVPEQAVKRGIGRPTKVSQGKKTMRELKVKKQTYRVDETLQRVEKRKCMESMGAEKRKEMESETASKEGDCPACRGRKRAHTCPKKLKSRQVVAVESSSP